MGKKNKQKNRKKNSETDVDINIEDLNWDELKEEKIKIGKNIIYLQQTCLELLKIHTDIDKEINDEINGITLSLKDLATELKDLTDKYNLDNRSGIVLAIEPDGKDAMDYISCMYGMVNIEEKLVVLNSTSILDVITKLTSNDTLVKSTENLKEVIKETYGK